MLRGWLFPSLLAPFVPSGRNARVATAEPAQLIRVRIAHGGGSKRDRRRKIREFFSNISGSTQRRIKKRVKTIAIFFSWDVKLLSEPYPLDIVGFE